MVDLLIRDLGAATIALLQQRARKHARTAEQEAAHILTESMVGAKDRDLSCRGGAEVPQVWRSSAEVSAILRDLGGDDLSAADVQGLRASTEPRDPWASNSLDGRGEHRG